MNEATIEDIYQLPDVIDYSANDKGKTRDYVRVILTSAPTETNRSASPGVSYNGTFNLKNIPFTKVTPAVSAEDSLAREFERRATEWKDDTLGVSSLSDIFTHPAYQRIMSMGKPALPLILQDLRRELDHWFYALEFIAGKEGEDVARGTDTLEDARNAWLEWGYEHGYL